MELLTHRVFLLCCLLFSYNVGVLSSIVLSQEDDLKLEKQLKLINKPAAEIIETIDGHTYGCVDFYKQPTFDHPALRNHSYHYMMRPTFNRRKDDPNVNNISFGSLWKNGKGCPTGTVPIRRYTKDELAKVNAITQMYADANSSNESHNAVQNGFSNNVAVVYIDKTKGKKFNGAGMIASVHNHSVRVSQISGCRMMIGKGDEYIQVGWMTPQLQCFNQLCAGFVIVRSDIPPGIVYRDISKAGKVTYRTQYLIRKDPANRNWYLNVGSDTIGFWPSKIFNTMKNDVDYIDWGGVAVGPSDLPSPPMGYGTNLPADVDIYHVSYCSNLVEINEANKIVDVDSFRDHVDNKKGYYCEPQKPTRKYGSLMIYGGPGH